MNDDQVKSVELLFSRIKEEIDADYVHKYDVIRNYLQLLMHEAMKMSPAQSYERYNNASQRWLHSLWILWKGNILLMEQPTL